MDARDYGPRGFAHGIRDGKLYVVSGTTGFISRPQSLEWTLIIGNYAFAVFPNEASRYRQARLPQLISDRSHFAESDRFYLRRCHLYAFLGLMQN